MRRHDYDKLRSELLDAHARITETLRQLPDLWPELIDGLPGYPTSTGGAGTAPSLGAGGTPGGLDRFVTAADPAADDMRLLRQSAIAAANAGRTMLAVSGRWLNVTTPEDRQQLRGGGDCHACGIYCSGAATDRLRSGLCDACRQSWRRYQERTADERGGGDRGDWLLERRRDILTAEA